MRLVSWTRALVYLTIAILLLVACHKFFRFIDAAPYVAFDDSFANISVFLATEGKYGIPVAPFAGVGRAIRPDSTMNYVMNYGPPTFILGAALDWLFGTSYAVLRSTYFFFAGGDHLPCRNHVQSSNERCCIGLFIAASDSVLDSTMAHVST